MLGAIIGDIIGSPYEFKPHKSVDFPLITNRSYFTDDTVMTCAIAEALMNVIPKHGAIPSEKDFEAEVIKSMQKFAQKYPTLDMALASWTGLKIPNLTIVSAMALLCVLLLSLGRLKILKMSKDLLK